MNAPVAYHIPRPRLLLVHDGWKVALKNSARNGRRREFWHDEPWRGEGRREEPWRTVHHRISLLGKDRAAHERELCRGLLEAERLGVHAYLGYASLREYAERAVGLSARQCEERLRVGRVLEQLPQLEALLANGELCWSVVRELTRVATAENEATWLQWARGRRASEVAAAVAERKSGATPEDPAEPALVRHRLSFEVRAETVALLRELQAIVHRELGDPTLDDDTLLFEIARRALTADPRSGTSSKAPVQDPPRGGRTRPRGKGAADGDSSTETPTATGRPHYQIAVTCCASCGETSIEAGGRSHRIEPSIAEMIDCDAQIIGSVEAPQPTRSTQTIPPATRRAVLRRHHGRCAVPGCRHHRFVDIHHIVPRSEGGTHDLDNLVVLCGAHHRAHHLGHLKISGSTRAGLAFFHADGSPYGNAVRPARQDKPAPQHQPAHHLKLMHQRRPAQQGRPAQQARPTQHDITRRVLLALASLGFRKKEAEARLRAAQQALSAPADPALADPTPADPPHAALTRSGADFGDLLRAALAASTDSAGASP